jgi:hypothetical protein
MPSTVGSLLPYIDRGFRSLVDDQPLAGGFLEFFVNGSPGTHKNTFSQADLNPVSVQANPLQLDSTGRATVFLEPGLYDVTVIDPVHLLLYTIEGVGSGIAAPTTPVAVPLDTSGKRNATSGYTVIDTDHLITVNETVTEPAIINLPNVATRTTPLWIKNVGPKRVSVVPFGTNTIENGLTQWTMGSAASPSYFTIQIAPDTGGLTTWWILSSHNPASAG